MSENLNPSAHDRDDHRKPKASENDMERTLVPDMDDADSLIVGHDHLIVDSDGSVDYGR